MHPSNNIEKVILCKKIKFKKYFVHLKEKLWINLGVFVVMKDLCNYNTINVIDYGVCAFGFHFL